jgi:hypothetical protein
MIVAYARYGGVAVRRRAVGAEVVDVGFFN